MPRQLKANTRHVPGCKGVFLPACSKVFSNVFLKGAFNIMFKGNDGLINPLFSDV